MHRNHVQQHFNNLKAAGLSAYEAEAVVRKAFDKDNNPIHRLTYTHTADVLLYGTVWHELPGTTGSEASKVYAPAHTKLSEDKYGSKREYPNV